MLTRVIRTTGELLITAGLILLFFVAYELWGTGVHTARAQNAAADALELQWATGVAFPGEFVDDPVVSSPAPDPSASPEASATPDAPTASPEPVPDIPLGTGLARLRIPRFGSDYQWVIGEGVGHEALKDGPGHYPGTALPGQVGNFVVSGHRTTYGAPFSRLGDLQPGDAIVVETAKTWHTYRVRSQEIVEPTRISVTLPVPNEEGAKPTERLLTFTTCHPRFSAKQRLILYAVLDSSLAKADGQRPPALQAAA